LYLSPCVSISLLTLKKWIFEQLCIYDGVLFFVNANEPYENNITQAISVMDDPCRSNGDALYYSYMLGFVDAVPRNDCWCERYTQAY
ncbi:MULTISPECIES: hypothetical protein, partial [unclassified Cedecea]|uniref:hypothetical protein n=2 Tax=Enterobacterales TaxID=91347 RepID=UPI003018D3DB